MNAAAENLAFLSLGSNISPEIHLPAAVRMLAKSGELRRVSRAWQSPPFGYARQADFVNAAVLLATDLKSEAIIEELIPLVERQLRRKRDPRNKNGPRTIDVDLSLYNHDRGQRAGKTIPDPAILQRLFVSWPLAELDPDYCHPVVGRTLRRIVDQQIGQLIRHPLDIGQQHDKPGQVEGLERHLSESGHADSGADTDPGTSDGSADELRQLGQLRQLGLHWRADIELSPGG